jgi:FlaA1/EpsC-like NDP-sugar epimerase
MSRTAEKGVLIYGAGEAGMQLVHDLRSSRSNIYKIYGFVDDDHQKHNSIRMGVKVLGSGRDLAKILHRFRRVSPPIQECIIAMPSASGRSMGEVLANCRAAEIACTTFPGLSDLLSGKVSRAQIREVSTNDLLGREPVKLEEERVKQNYAGRCVMITGAAGSIGSELCRQVSALNPRLLIAFDQAESDLFRIDLELRDKFPKVKVVPEIGDIRDLSRVEEVIRVHRVDSIIHAAAYKHVPLMEAQVLEAVKNNIFGTWNLVRAAYRNHVSDFLMISSDKAVNPTNIMGVTKRVAELIVSAKPARSMQSGPKFVSVRFGNVLGSNGSVVPLFQAQIASGGPVTVTHPEIRRYFMTTKEAVQLVLQASTMGRGSEIFVLDMGDPIRVVDLARHMIELAGLIPDEDIEIRFTGLRPGEKLYEELITEGENIMPTYHKKVKIFQGERLDYEAVQDWMHDIERYLTERDVPAIVSHLKILVPEYASPEYRNSLAMSSARS